jgi:hypothetical protein
LVKFTIRPQSLNAEDHVQQMSRERRTTALGRRRSILYHAEIGSSGWIADFTNPVANGQVAP